ncbi:peroxisomal sarcosine oxidase-like [Littorina saxatilis]|uniref:sarcosine oxidasee (formaldehyde-forming) n=1 Tax=Littorina saxatilis TaxID=31220 RepID=A0AAN9AJN8_9CAEN
MGSEVFDVIVIGAGIEGSSSAYHLAKSGQKTLLLEQFPLPHSRGSSHGQSRITRYAYTQDYYTHMMLDSYPLWDTLEKEAGVNIYKKCGLLNIGLENGNFLGSVAGSMSRHGMDFQSFQSSEFQRRYPMLRYPPRSGAILDPMGGILRADKALAAFQTMFKQLGGVLREGETVKVIRPGQPLVTVTTTKGEYRAKKVVMATGPWTSKLLEPLGLRLPLKPIRITVCYWRENRETTPHSSDRFPCIIDGGQDDGEEFHVYGLPSEEYPGYVKVCLHDGPDIDPDARDEADDTWVREKVTDYVRQHFPWLQGSPGIVEACIYTNTPDNDPVIDYHPQHSNIIIAAGFSGHGFKLAPAVGKAVTELALNKPLSYNMAPFAVSRFNAASSKL